MGIVFINLLILILSWLNTEQAYLSCLTRIQVLPDQEFDLPDWLNGEVNIRMGIVPLYDAISPSAKANVEIKYCTTLMTKEKYWQVRSTASLPKSITLSRELPVIDDSECFCVYGLCPEMGKGKRGLKTVRCYFNVYSY